MYSHFQFTALYYERSCSPDLFCSAALIASSFCLVTNNIQLVDEAAWVLIMRLTWHFYLSSQVRSWRSKQVMNVILPTLTDWFPYGKGISTPARSWIWRSVTVRLCHNMMIKVLEAGYTDRDCTVEYVASDTRGSSLKSSWNFDETTMTVPTSIDAKKTIYAYAAIYGGL